MGVRVATLNAWGLPGPFSDRMSGRMEAIGETMSDDREKRLVNEFLTQVSAEAPSGDNRN